jgi:enoyl-CoA hydratase/carnithine racemase
MSKSIKLEQLNDVVTITFDQENSIANVFDENMFAELNDHLDFI